MSENPFFEDWITPFGVPPFDRIRAEHFPAAFDRGMQEQITEINVITDSAASASFANTIEAIERSGRLLDRVSRVFFNLAASNTDDVLEAIARDYAPRLAQHQMRIVLDAKLFERIADLHARRASLELDPDQLRLVERYYLRFIRSGAMLTTEKKQRMTEISEQLASLHTLFGQNVLHDERDWQLVLDGTDLDGLPPFARAAAAQAAEERGISGRFAVTLSRSAVEPFLTFSSRRDLRRELWQAWTARGACGGAADNAPIISKIVALRGEQARLLGYETFADYRLDDTMAKTGGAVEGLLLQVWEPAKQKARDERAAHPGSGWPTRMGRALLRPCPLWSPTPRMPTAIAETLKALRTRYKNRRLWAILEPRSNTLRRNVFFKELTASLALADEIVVASVFKAEAIPEGERLSSSELVKELNRRKHPARECNDADAIVDSIAPELRDGDVVAILSNGGFGGIYEKLPARLKSLAERQSSKEATAQA